MSGRFKRLLHKIKHDDDDDNEHEYEPRTSADDAGRRSTSRRSVDVPSSPPQSSSYAAASPGRSPQVGGSPLHGQAVPLSPSRTSRDNRRSSDVPRSPVMKSERGQSLVAAATSSPTGPTRQSRDLPRSGAPDHTLELGSMGTDLSRDLQHLTLGGDNRYAAQPTGGQYERDIMRRNVPGGQSGQPTYGRDVPVIPSRDQYSEGVAERNLEHNRYASPQAGAVPDAYSRQAELRSSTVAAPYAAAPSVQPNGPRKMSITRKPVDPTSSISSGAVAPASPPRVAPAAPPRASVVVPPQNASLNKPLPAAPPAEPVLQRAPVPDQRIQDPAYLLKDKQIAPHLAQVLNLSHTEDTDVQERWAPAVTHETVHRQIHHVREERITREIHNHHVIHRILPIIDVEVLPARHLIPTFGGGFVEVAEEHIPGRTIADRDRTHHAMRNWVIAETASRLPSNESAHVGPRQFTARTFAGNEGDFKKYVGPDGVERTEQWWVHPPTIEDGARLTGQTVPMHFYWTADGRLETRPEVVDAANGAAVVPGAAAVGKGASFRDRMEAQDLGIGARTVGTAGVAGAAGAAGLKGRRRHGLHRSASSSSISSVDSGRLRY